MGWGTRFRLEPPSAKRPFPVFLLRARVKQFFSCSRPVQGSLNVLEANDVFDHDGIGSDASAANKNYVRTQLGLMRNGGVRVDLIKQVVEEVYCRASKVSVELGSQIRHSRSRSRERSNTDGCVGRQGSGQSRPTIGGLSRQTPWCHGRPHRSIKALYQARGSSLSSWMCEVGAYRL